MMAGPRGMRLLPRALVALLLASASRADDTLNFDFYPSGSQNCLSQAAVSSKCESSTVSATNSCLCRNGGNFITNAAACIGRSSPGDQSAVYKIMSQACSTSQTPISVSQADFLAAAAATSSTSTTSTSLTSSTTSAASSTTTTTTTSSAATTTAATTTAPATTTAAGDQQGKQGGQGTNALSTAALAGIVVGAVAAGALLAGLVFFVLRRRRRVGEEAHPMLPQQQPHVSAVPGPRQSSAYYGSPPTTAGWPKSDWGPSPDMRNSGFNWESPAHLGYGGGPLAPSPPLPPQELDGVQHYPSGSVLAPAEMGTTPIATTVQPNMPYRPYNSGQ